MPELEIKDEIKQMGTTRYIPLPKWFCDQLKLDGGIPYTLSMKSDSDDTLTLVFSLTGKGLSRKAKKQ